MDNRRTLAVGIGTVVGLYFLSGATFWLVASQFWPGSQPVSIERFQFLTPLVAGGDTSVAVEVDKSRHCQPAARIVFANAEGEERQFLFPEWPWFEPGRHKVRFLMAVPSHLYPGQFKAQARIYYSCPEQDYVVLSEQTDVEILAPQGTR